jgi:hypothetical protein
MRLPESAPQEQGAQGVILFLYNAFFPFSRVVFIIQYPGDTALSLCTAMRRFDVTPPGLELLTPDENRYRHHQKAGRKTCMKKRVGRGSLTLNNT